jgi:hypothetical protein
MERLELQSFYELGGHLANLENATKLPRDVKWNLATLDSLITALAAVVESKALPLMTEAAQNLLDTINALLDDVMPWQEASDPPNDEVLAKIREQIASFKSVLTPQWKRIHAYRVTPKGLMDPSALIERPHDAFDSEQWKHLPDIVHSDWNSACRCLAFDLPTASGFHVLRCIEAVALNYLDKLQVPKPTKGNCNLGSYLDLLKQNKASPDTVDAAHLIRRLYRNPLMHPEDTLTSREALNLLNVCGAMIQALLDDMQTKGLFDPPKPIVAP